MKVAVILQCSKNKSLTPKPAIESYSGRNYNKVLPMVKPLGDIFILSSHYGLISGDTMIETYDSTFETVPPGYAKNYSIEYKREFKKIGLDQQSKMVPVVKSQLHQLNGYDKIITIFSKSYMNVFLGAGGKVYNVDDWQHKCGGIFNLPKHITNKIDEYSNNRM
tara:strand:- start:157 stop:648 length:492 start_codon:yes stop_codon:yes gene_type:complete